LTSGSIVHCGTIFQQNSMTAASHRWPDKSAWQGELYATTSHHPCDGTVPIATSTICRKKGRQGMTASREVTSVFPMTQKERSTDQPLETGVADPFLIVTAASVELEPAPIPLDWIVSGSPVARCKKMVRSRDRSSHIVVWDCTPGSFKWHYGMDETIVLISGESFMINEKGEERRFGPGDLGFFPAGTSCTWRITETVRKVAVLKESTWNPLRLGVKAWHKLLRVVVWPVIRR
jgi:uncharacterized cupin superfamily protein